jgi:hypothetical protein
MKIEIAAQSPSPADLKFRNDAALTLSQEFRRGHTPRGTNHTTSKRKKHTPMQTSHRSNGGPHDHNFSLTKKGKNWELVFEGETTHLKNELGLYYVAYLLSHPYEEPMHPVNLQVKARDDMYEGQRCETTYTDPDTGKTLALPKDAELQQLSLRIEEAESAYRLFQKQLELEALVDSDDATEPVKAEAYRQLEDIYRYQRQSAGRTRDLAQKTSQAVTKAIKRFCQKLSVAVNSDGSPNQLLRRFAEHLKLHLLIPSGRLTNGGRTRNGTTRGCFTYHPGNGVAWRS